MPGLHRVKKDPSVGYTVRNLMRDGTYKYVKLREPPEAYVNTVRDLSSILDGKDDWLQFVGPGRMYCSYCGAHFGTAKKRYRKSLKRHATCHTHKTMVNGKKVHAVCVNQKDETDVTKYLSDNQYFHGIIALAASHAGINPHQLKAFLSPAVVEALHDIGVPSEKLFRENMDLILESVMNRVKEEVRNEKQVGLFFDGSTSVNSKHHIIFGSRYVYVRLDAS